MNLEGAFVVARPADEVWAALNDPAVLARAIPGRSGRAAEGSAVVSRLGNAGGSARDNAVIGEVLQGNIPDFLRNLVPVTFTGSVNTGMHVMQAAARNITNVTLELGGKSPVVVLADADLEHTVEEVVWAINSNAGQVCSAGSRLVIEKSIHGEFMERLVNRTKALSIGHGLRGKDVSAINSQMQVDKISDFVKDARARGLEIATGGNPTHDPETGKGFFFEPTIVNNVAADDRLVQEEICGPELSVQVADDFDHALALANGTDFGLMSAIFTRDLSKAHRFIRHG